MTKFKIILFFIVFYARAELEFNLLTTLYNENNEKRLKEYKKCFKENLKNKHIKKIFVFFENYNETQKYSFLKDSKIQIIPIKSRPTYKFYFDFANKYLKEELIIISNTDIFFDDSLSYLNKVDFKNKVFALTRYNVPEYKGKWKRHERSHDSWIFKSPFKEINANIKLGVPGCDNEVLILFKKNNIQVINPSLTIKSWHVHLDDKRNYTESSYKGSYKIVIPFTKL